MCRWYAMAQAPAATIATSEPASSAATVSAETIGGEFDTLGNPQAEILWRVTLPRRQGHRIGHLEGSRGQLGVTVMQSYVPPCRREQHWTGTRFRQGRSPRGTTATEPGC